MVRAFGRTHPQRSRPRSSAQRWLRRLGIALLTWIGLTTIVVLLLRWVAPPGSAFMLEHRLAARWAGSNSAVHHQFVPLRELSPALPIALVAAEDQKFPLHHGFDVQAIADAMDDADEGARLRGASTISQQTAKNLFLWNGRSFVRKGFEAYFTVLLELLWPKSRILEVYANIAEFGDGIYGAEAAARTYFGKPASQLNEREAALLAAVLPNPKKSSPAQPSPYVLRRADWIERQARQLGGAAYLAR
ncbi:MAG: monofunctional biosynthetic peptidoglycan transglycosylase [Steroidobacteraceae bacterium]